MKSDDRYEIRFSGSGGQGIITAAMIMAVGAGAYDNKYVCQSQSSGPEARGGKSKAEVVLSENPIDYPKALHVDLLLAMNQTACDAYFFDLKPDGLLVVDSGLVQQLPTSRSVSIPFTQIAIEQIGKELVANMVALGAVGYLCGQVSLDGLKHVLLSRVPKGTEQLNAEALDAGIEEAKKIDLDSLPRSVLSEWDDEL